MAISAIAEEYFSTLNPIAAKIHEDIVETRNSYENIWDSLSEKEKKSTPPRHPPRQHPVQRSLPPEFYINDCWECSTVQKNPFSHLKTISTFLIGDLKFQLHLTHGAPAVRPPQGKPDLSQAEIINESIIKPEIALKYALLDTLDFDINDPPVHKDDLMSFFGREQGQKIIQDENGSYRDEYSAPFLYQTKSQLNLCILSESRKTKDVQCTSPPPVMSELALSHSKVVNELKNALKSHDVLKSTYKDSNREVVSPTSFISKFMGNFKGKDEERECLVSSGQAQIVASSDNFFRTSYKSPQNERFEKEYRSSVAKSSSDLSEENRGLLSSQASSGTDFHSTETLTETAVPKTGYDFLDNW